MVVAQRNFNILLLGIDFLFLEFLCISKIFAKFFSVGILISRSDILRLIWLCEYSSSWGWRISFFIWETDISLMVFEIRKSISWFISTLSRQSTVFIVFGSFWLSIGLIHQVVHLIIWAHAGSYIFLWRCVSHHQFRVNCLIQFLIFKWKLSDLFQ